MVKDRDALKKFEDGLAKKSKLSFKKALKIIDAMWKEALSLGVIKKSVYPRDIENKIKMAKIINRI